ncbi:MAG: ferredoxin--NADP reductase [Alphaproteobacteria bacterium]|nr:ferredoxin--NADP reductase [Alphaproteobacteria bacterium]
MPDTDKWTKATVVDRIVWDEGLFTSRLDLSPDFKPGQFATLALADDDADGDDDALVKRAYSIASAPNQPLEFFIVHVDGGALSPRLWGLEPGQEVWVRNKIAGLFTLDRVPDGEVLWLVATGTGLAPYISMLRQGDVFDRFEHVVVVQGARYARQLAYREELMAMTATRPVTYVPTCTREKCGGLLTGRVTDLLEGGVLEGQVGHTLHPDGHHVMLCGNPEMVMGMLAMLKARGMQLHKPREEGQVHIEKYW